LVAATVQISWPPLFSFHGRLRSGPADRWHPERGGESAPRHDSSCANDLGATCRGQYRRRIATDRPPRAQRVTQLPDAPPVTRHADKTLRQHLSAGWAAPLESRL